MEDHHDRQQSDDYTPQSDDYTPQSDDYSPQSYDDTSLSDDYTLNPMIIPPNPLIALSLIPLIPSLLSDSIPLMYCYGPQSPHPHSSSLNLQSLHFSAQP
jgi:hypothetical protein